MSGKQTTTQASTSEPWKPAQPALQTGLTDAQNLYKAGIGGQVNTQSNVVPFAQQTTQAMNAGQNMANQNIGGQGLSGQYQNVINNGGFNSQQQEALGGIRNTANASFDPMNQAGFGSVLKQAQDAAGGAVNQQASGMGRFGGAAHQGLLAKSVGDVTGNLLNTEYNNYLGRQSAAQNQLFNAGQTGMGNLGSAYQGMQAPLDTLGQIGASYEDLAGRQITDRNRIFDAQNNMPWDQLARLNGVASGMGSMGGTSSGTATTPGANPFGLAVGGLTALSGLFG